MQSKAYWPTWEQCSNTSSLKRLNPSWICGWFRAKDRKWVNGCFLRKLSIKTSTRVTADATAAFWEPVITDKPQHKHKGTLRMRREQQENTLYKSSTKKYTTEKGATTT